MSDSITITVSPREARYLHDCLSDIKNLHTRHGQIYDLHQTNAQLRTRLENAMAS